MFIYVFVILRRVIIILRRAQTADLFLGFLF